MKHASTKSGANEDNGAANDAGATVATAATDAMITTKSTQRWPPTTKLKAIKIDVDTRDGHVVLAVRRPTPARANARHRWPVPSMVSSRSTTG